MITYLLIKYGSKEQHKRRAASSSFSMLSVIRRVATMTRTLRTSMARGTSRKTSSSVVHDQMDQTCSATSGLMSQMPVAAENCQK